MARIPTPPFLCPLVLPLLLAASALACSLGLAGCVMADYDSETTTMIEPPSTITATMPDGKIVKTETAAKTITTRRKAGYHDTRGVGAAASGVLSDFGGISGIASSLTGTQVALGGGGLLTLIVGGAMKLAHLAGQNVGYTQHQVESAPVVPAVVPSKGTA